MNYDKIKDTVNKHGLITTLNLFGGNKDIIRKAYIDNPESYLDYLIGNLRKVNRTVVSDLILFRYGDKTIFKSNQDEYDRKNSGGIILVDDFIWEYFYVNVMNFTNDQIQEIGRAHV